MIQRPFQHRRIAWLGLLAIWLVALAPVVSQTLFAMRGPAAPAALVHAGTVPVQVVQTDASPHAHHGMHHAAPAMSAAPHAHDAQDSGEPADAPHTSHGDDPLHACDYCELFAHAPIVFAIAHPAPAALPATAPVPALPAAPAPRPFSSLVAAPRGPPRASAIA